MNYKLNQMFVALIILMLSVSFTWASKLKSIKVVDQDYLMLTFWDGEVINHEKPESSEIVDYLPLLNTTAIQNTSSWKLTSVADANYGSAGQSPTQVYYKKKLNGHAQLGWNGSENDFNYQNTYEYTVYLQLPSSMVQGNDYQLEIADPINSDLNSYGFTFDIFNQISEAVHVNLVGYNPQNAQHAADLYIWMGDGGGRDYSTFEGNKVYLYNIDTQEQIEAGTVSFWKNHTGDFWWTDLTMANVWNVDFTGTAPGNYRIAVEGVGASNNFIISDMIYFNPFKIATLGYFYMRIGEEESSANPPPRQPRYIPNVDPANTKVYITSMHPWHAEWGTFASGDAWDQPDSWASYRLSGNPTNDNAIGGHSDAYDWDRHIGHISNIYDMLLPFILSQGKIDDDDFGIPESGNTIPDIIDEAQNEVDFWLSLRDSDNGYGAGVTGPSGSNELYQAGSNAFTAWAAAASSAMLAEAFRISGHTTQMTYYKDAAEEAYTRAVAYSNQMLDDTFDLGYATVRGRDLKFMAASYLYNVTGDTNYEDVINSESICTTASSQLDKPNTHNQIWASAAYLLTPQTVNYQSLQDNMKASVIFQAKAQEADLADSRVSRRSTMESSAYWRGAQNVQQSMIAHAISTGADKANFLRTMTLEADWGLGRNPMNIIEMTTATTDLENIRSITEAYTSGRNDGVKGVHPGHTPYLNPDDWWCSMDMGCPSSMYDGDKAYPAAGAGFKNWPRGETYFNTRYVFAANEFTPRQTMRGKIGLYGYLYSLRDSDDGDITNTNPRPTNDLIFENNNLIIKEEGLYVVRVFDLKGNAIQNFSQQYSSGSHQLELNLNSGVYILNIQGTGFNYSKRIIQN